MAFDWETEPTLTLEEYVHSYHPANWVPRNIEDLLYWELKMATLLAPYGVKLAWFMTRGLPFAEAGYMASQGSIGAYRFVRRLDRIRIVATNPMLAVGAAAAVSAYYVHTSPPPTQAHRSEPGQTSWWRAVAQAMTGTGPGIGGANVGF